MKIKVTKNECLLEEENIVNKGEYNITEIEFEFSKEYTNDLVKKAIFSTDLGSYEKLIINNKCTIPEEVLRQKGYMIIGVYAFKVENETLDLRYSPKPFSKYIEDGSYTSNIMNSEELTPTDKEQIEQNILDLQNKFNDMITSVYDYSEVTVLNAHILNEVVNSSASNRTLFLPVEEGNTYYVGRMILNSKYFIIGFSESDEIGSSVFEKTLVNVNGQRRLFDNPVKVIAPNNAKYMCIWFYNNSDSYSIDELGKSIYIYKKDFLYKLIESAMGVFKTNTVRVNQNTYTNELSDFNQAKKSTAYVIYYGANYTNIPLNCPVNRLTNALLLNYASEDFNTTIQFFVTQKEIYYRACDDNGRWDNWVNLLQNDEIPMTFYIGAEREYTTLKEGIAEAVKYKNSKVYVDSGTYDIIEEYGGQEYVNLNYTGQSMGDGIVLKNGVHVIFSTNSKVTCNFAGTNVAFRNNFSPFNVGAGGFTLENANIEASNCRYCVHDDMFSQDDTYTETHYKNCKMYLDNNQNSVRENYNCIGGGMPINGSVEIDGCVFETTAHLSQNDMRGGVDYHQNGNENAQSRILIKNSVCVGSKDGFSCSTLGTSTKKSIVIVTNCKSQLPVVKVSTAGAPDNVELIEFDNEYNIAYKSYVNNGFQTKITNNNKLSSDLVDDTNNNNKFVTSSDMNSWNAKYDKPVGGIPKTDLDSSVQTSLGKADTAIQEHQDITGKEDKSNKVTSISSSSTDTQYPSAKCVYDIVGNIENILEELDVGGGVQ